MVEKEIERFPTLRITEQGRRQSKDTVVREFSLTGILNNQEVATLLCSPTDLKYLAIGFLASEGLVKNKDKIKKIIVNGQGGCGEGRNRRGEKGCQSHLQFVTIKPQKTYVVSSRIINDFCFFTAKELANISIHK